MLTNKAVEQGKIIFEKLRVQSNAFMREKPPLSDVGFTAEAKSVAVHSPAACFALCE